MHMYTQTRGEAGMITAKPGFSKNEGKKTEGGEKKKTYKEI